MTPRTVFPNEAHRDRNLRTCFHPLTRVITLSPSLWKARDAAALLAIIFPDVSRVRRTRDISRNR